MLHLQLSFRPQINHYFPKFFRSDDTETPEKVLLIAQGSTTLGMKAAPKTRPHLEKHVGRQLSACEGGTGWGNSARIAGVKSGGSRLFLDGRSILQLGSMVLDEVAQVFQLDGKIDIVDRDALWSMQHHGRKIENTGHSSLHQ